MNRPLKIGLSFLAFSAVSLPLAWFFIPKDANNGWGPFGTVVCIILFIVIPGTVMTIYGMIKRLVKKH